MASLKHIFTRNFSFPAITSTGRERKWATGTVKKDPGPTVRPEYHKEYNVKRRALFDPRPTAHILNSPSSTQLADNFVFNLQHLPIKYEDFGVTRGGRSDHPVREISPVQ